LFMENIYTVVSMTMGASTKYDGGMAFSGTWRSPQKSYRNPNMTEELTWTICLISTLTK
jgi:hypothetical protein